MTTEYDVEIEAESKAALESAFRAMDKFEAQRQLAVELEQRLPDEEFVIALENVLLEFRQPDIADVKAHWFLLSLAERLAERLDERWELTGNVHDGFRLGGSVAELFYQMQAARKVVLNPPQPSTQYLPTRQELDGVSDGQLCRIFGWYDERSGKVDVLKARAWKRGEFEAPETTVLPPAYTMQPEKRPKLDKLRSICNAIAMARQQA